MKPFLPDGPPIDCTDEQFANAMLRLKMACPLRRLVDGAITPAVSPDVDIVASIRNVAARFDPRRALTTAITWCC